MTTTNENMLLNAPVSLLADALAESIPNQKILAIKVIRKMTGLGLKESKDLIDAAHRRVLRAQKVLLLADLEKRLLHYAGTGENDMLLATAEQIRTWKIELGE